MHSARCGEIDAASVTATVPRSEIEAALAADDGPSDLILDVARTDDGGGRRIAVEWDRGDLERLLSRAEADAIVFAFERAPLALAFADPDVEGHGLRQKALVLTVAAATAAGAAGAAKAVPELGDGGTFSTPDYSAIETTRSAEAAQGPLAGYAGVEAARAADAAPDALLAGYAGVETVGADVAAELGTGLAAAEHTAVEAARADAPGQSTVGDGGGTFAVETPSPAQTAALAGAAALAITGAAFMARSRRRLTPSS